jgi:hypothetical protein
MTLEAASIVIRAYLMVVMRIPNLGRRFSGWSGLVAMAWEGSSILKKERLKVGGLNSRSIKVFDLRKIFGGWVLHALSDPTFFI